MRKLTMGIFLASGLLLVYVIHSRAQTPPKAQDSTRAASSAPTVLDGPTLFKTYCAVCHGPAAKGDGPMSKLLTAKTPDLTRVAERHGGKFPRTQVDGIISGESSLPGHGTRDMPIWGPVFSQVGRDTDMGRVRVDNVARYLESIQEK